ncbi:HSP20-like chaperones superfamily protein [Euphorbia peplus]|nr:HSP20-like chaperones superfamily protein [Euphorbia peplus]
MANNFGERIGSIDHSVKEFVPYAAWTEDSLNHFLLLDLPEFKKEEVKLQVEKTGEIRISGERVVSDNKYLYFDKSFKAPQSSDLEKVTAKFEGEILYVNVPKKQLVVAEESPGNKIEQKYHNSIIQEKIQDHEQTAHDEMKSSDDGVQHFEREKKEEKKGTQNSNNSMFQRAIFMLGKNRHILLTAAFAFSLGVFVSRKFESSPSQQN